MTLYAESDPKYQAPPRDPYRVWERLKIATGREGGAERTWGELLFDYRAFKALYHGESQHHCTGWVKGVLPRYCRRPMCPYCWHVRQTRFGAAIMASPGPFWHVIWTHEAQMDQPLSPQVLARFHGNRDVYHLICWTVAPFIDWSIDGVDGTFAWRKVGVFVTDRPVRRRGNGQTPDGGWMTREQYDNLDEAYEKWLELNPHPGPLLRRGGLGTAERDLERWNNTYWCISPRCRKHADGVEQGSDEPDHGQDEPGMGMNEPDLGLDGLQVQTNSHD